MAATNGQLASLTGLRFFAALSVVFYHLRLYFAPIEDGLAIFGYGFTGVSFFFILSGFVLTWSHRPGVRPAKFYVNRVARIWPLHILTTVMAFGAPLLPTSSPPTWEALPFVLTLTQAWLPASPFLNAFNGVAWSLSCEAFFYLLFPLLFKNLVARPRPAAIIGIVLTAMLVMAIVLGAVSSIPAADYLLGTMPLYRLGEFVAGICLALMMKRGWRPSFSLLHALGLLALLTFSLFAASFLINGMSGPVPVIYSNLIMIPGFLALIAASAARDLSGKSGFLTSTAVVRLGQWSYALYLVHELVLRVARPYLTDRSMVDVFGIAAIVVAVSIITSGVLHEFIEKPAEKRLRSWWTSRVMNEYTTRDRGHQGDSG